MDETSDDIGLLSSEQKTMREVESNTDRGKIASSTTRGSNRQQWIFYIITWSLLGFVILQSTISFGTKCSASDSLGDRPSEPDSNSLHVVATWDKTGGSCGRNPVEARERGCIFDIMRYAWIHPDCYDKEAAEEALARNPWGWYKDQNGTMPLRLNELESYAVAYTQWGYHTEHCRYLYRLAGRASKYNELITDDLSSYSHALHCGMVLAEDRFKPERVGTIVTMWYAVCGKLLVANLELFEGRDD